MAGQTGRNVEVEGVAETQRAFRRAAARAEAIEDREAAEIVADDARRRVRVDTGALLGTIAVVDLTPGAAVVAGSPVVDYAPYVQARYPFLDDARRSEVVDFYEDEVADLVRGFERDAP